VTVIIDLPAEAQARLQAEADRRGTTIDEVVAEFAARLPGETSTHRLRFVGIGSSGRNEPLDIRGERSELAVKKFAEGI
jgi:hypothetical protein